MLLKLLLCLVLWCDGVINIVVNSLNTFTIIHVFPTNSLDVSDDIVRETLTVDEGR